MNAPWSLSNQPVGAAPVFNAHDLMREILHLAAQRWTDPQTFATLTTRAGFRSAPARIFFLTQLRERVRLLPLKLFVSADTREKLLESLQSALDQEISREEMT